MSVYVTVARAFPVVASQSQIWRERERERERIYLQRNIIGTQWMHCTAVVSAATEDFSVPAVTSLTFICRVYTRIHVARIHIVSSLIITCCIHLYPFVSPVAVYLYPVSATKLSSRRHVSTCIRIYELLVRDTCIRLHVSGVNAAL